MTLVNRLVTFEGIEGSGKSTQIKLVADYLIKRGVELVVTQEPTGTDIGRKIGEILFNREHGHLCAEAEMLLFCAARAQHVRTVIIPALEKNKLVLCDRFSDATYAYQGFGRGLNQELIGQINDYSTILLKPALTLLFDLPVEAGLRRATARDSRLSKASAADRFEREKIDFHQRIRDGYLDIARKEPKRFCLIDASRDVDVIQQDVRRCIDNFIVETPIPKT